MKQALITGGTRGIGRACAEALAGAGYGLTVVSRTVEELRDMQSEWRKEYPNAPLRTIAADLEVLRHVNAVPPGPYDLVILNAGRYLPGRLTDEDRDVYTQLLGLNLLANHRLVRRLLPPMVTAGRGHLIIIGSTGTDHFKDHMTAYVATKYALRGLYLGLEKELATTNVRTTLVSPGATLTGSWENETPPADILRPGAVARVVLEAVREGRTGRITV